MPIPAWTSPLIESIDRRDWDTFAGFLTEDASFRYGSYPAVSGQEAIKEAAAAALAPFSKVAHQVIDGWEAEGVCILQGRVSYHLADGPTHTLPFMNLFRMEDKKIREYLIYIDPTPLIPR